MPKIIHLDADVLRKLLANPNAVFVGFVRAATSGLPESVFISIAPGQFEPMHMVPGQKAQVITFDEAPANA